MTSTIRNHTTTIIVIILTAILIYVHHGRNGIPDDGFITYRYAANLITGNGFVYNPGEAILGTTTPGYGLLVGLLATPFDVSVIPTVARISNLILLVALISVAVSIAINMKLEKFVWIIPLVILTEPKTTYGMISGMEPILFLLLTSGCYLALLTDRYILSAGLAGTLLWIRPEGIFVIALIALVLLIIWRQHKITFSALIQSAAAMTTPVLVYLGMLITVYDTLVPQSVTSKLTGLYNLVPLSIIGRLLDAILEFWYGYLMLISGNTAFTLADLSIPALAALLVLTILFFIIGSRQLIRHHLLLGLIPAYTALLIFFYATRDTYLFRWYFSLIGFPLTITIGTGIYSMLVAVLPRRYRKRAVWIAASIVLLGGFLNHPWLQYIRTPTHPAYVQDREAYYYDLAHRIDADLPQDSQLAMPEIGVLGFYLLDHPILDTAGLVSPEAPPYFPPPLTDQFGGIAPQLIRDQRPPFILTFDIFVQYTDDDLPPTAQQPLLAQDWFAETYEIVFRESLTLSYFNRDQLTMFVFAQRDAASSFGNSP